ncbi:GNAT family N-acetyltransferase [Lachnospiraceae bacterium MD308]|nr:GNAT family N-acetyltransferase [Lachnospiraceae bacterium MD308]
MIKIRKAALDDFDFFYKLKCEETNVYWTGHGSKPDRENLFFFFKNAVDNAEKKETRKIYIVESGGEKVGHIYIIPREEHFELATAISQKYQGYGYAKKAIALGLNEGRRMGYRKMKDAIREDNIASLKAYQACGVNVTEEYRMVYIPKLDKEVKMYIVEKKLD